MAFGQSVSKIVSNIMYSKFVPKAICQDLQLASTEWLIACKLTFTPKHFYQNTYSKFIQFSNCIDFISSALSFRSSSIILFSLSLVHNIPRSPPLSNFLIALKIIIVLASFNSDWIPLHFLEVIYIQNHSPCLLRCSISFINHLLIASLTK